MVGEASDKQRADLWKRFESEAESFKQLRGMIQNPIASNVTRQDLNDFEIRSKQILWNLGTLIMDTKAFIGKEISQE